MFLLVSSLKAILDVIFMLLNKLNINGTVKHNGVYVTVCY